jgi:hypothetical protein
MLTICSEPGCKTIVMGGRCLEHDRRQVKTFVRGRPFITVGLDEPAEMGSVARSATDSWSAYGLPRSRAGLLRSASRL